LQGLELEYFASAVRANRDTVGDGMANQIGHAQRHSGFASFRWRGKPQSLHCLHAQRHSGFASFRWRGKPQSLHCLRWVIIGQRITQIELFGASLRVWRDYFPNARVYGADIDDSVLFSEPGIQTFHLDQTDPASIGHMWQKIKEPNFDLIIDDGLHEFDAGSCLFKHSAHRLGPSGIYIIEDVKAHDLVAYRAFLDPLPYLVDYVNLHRPDMEVENNSLVVIRHDESRSRSH